MRQQSFVFIEYLIVEHLELKPIYDAHVEYYEEVLPHVLFGEFTSYVILLAADMDRNNIFLTGFLSSMEKGISSGEADVVNLIMVSFVENLMGEYEVIDQLAGICSPELLRTIKEVTNYNQARSSN